MSNSKIMAYLFNKILFLFLISSLNDMGQYSGIPNSMPKHPLLRADTSEDGNKSLEEEN